MSPGGNYRHRSLEILHGCAKMWVKSERIGDWPYSMLSRSGTTSYVCLSQRISEVASNLKAALFSAQWTRSRRQGANLHHSFPRSRGGRALRGAETGRLIKYRKRERLSLHLLFLFLASWHSGASVRWVPDNHCTFTFTDGLKLYIFVYCACHCPICVDLTGSFRHWVN